MREDFYQDLLDAGTAIPEEPTPQHIADAHIDRHQKRQVKDYYPIYSRFEKRNEFACYILCY